MMTTTPIVRINMNTILASSYERIRRNIELLWKVDDSVELVSFALEDGTWTVIVNNSTLKKYPRLATKRLEVDCGIQYLSPLMKNVTFFHTKGSWRALFNCGRKSEVQFLSNEFAKRQEANPSLPSQSLNLTNNMAEHLLLSPTDFPIS